MSAIIHRPTEGKIKTVTVSKNCSNQYFAAILLDDGKDKPNSKADGKVIGIDLGLNHFAVTSDRAKFGNPRIFNKHEKNLKLKQQQLSRKKKVQITASRLEKKFLEFIEKLLTAAKIF